MAFFHLFYVSVVDGLTGIVPERRLCGPCRPVYPILVHKPHITIRTA